MVRHFDDGGSSIQRTYQRDGSNHHDFHNTSSDRDGRDPKRKKHVVRSSKYCERPTAALVSLRFALTNSSGTFLNC